MASHCLGFGSQISSFGHSGCPFFCCGLFYHTPAYTRFAKPTGACDAKKKRFGFVLVLSLVFRTSTIPQIKSLWEPRLPPQNTEEQASMKFEFAAISVRNASACTRYISYFLTLCTRCLDFASIFRDSRTLR